PRGRLSGVDPSRLRCRRAGDRGDASRLPGAPDAYVYGPICIDEAERGRRLANAMFAALRARLPGREGILFIRRDNPASLRAHAKLGMTEVAEFVHDGAVHAVLSYVG
ncbi:MAG TPA: hypothetical protein VHQ91_14695, partial [Geminicoccaceae bacterium]|nr:hypothetical protein [Geminicoccaceae bacterium]